MARRGRIKAAVTIREDLDRDEAQVVELVRELQVRGSSIFDRMKPVDAVGP